MARQPAPPTKPGTRKLSDVARHLILPRGITATGWPAARDTCRKLGVEFDDWQHGGGSAILAKRDDGLYAADAIVISIPRQVAKTFLIGWIVFALCIIRPNTTVIWTAHRFKTANETFASLKAMALSGRMAAHIENVTTSAADKAIRFRNGSRILFGARERGFGRGFTLVDVLVFDEAQILTENAIDDMLPATNQAENPLIIYMGTPPKPSDPGEVFTALREDALSGDSEGTLYIETSADEGADPLDREQWAKANPSYPNRTPARAMLRMRKNLTPESFLREALGIWDGTATVGAFSSGSWSKRATTDLPPDPSALGIAADLDQVFLSLGASGINPNTGRDHLGSVLRVRADVDRPLFVAEVARIQTEQGCAVAIDAKGPASFLIPDLEAAGVALTRGSLEDWVQACADLRKAVGANEIEHGNYDDLNAAVDAAGWRKVGDRRVFARKSGDIASLEAVAWARWAASNVVDYDPLDSIY